MKIIVQDYNIKDLIRMSGGILTVLSSPIKILNFIKTRISRIFKMEKSWGLPVHILLEPTRACNYLCPQCPRQTFAEIKNLNKMEITLEEFKYVMRQIGRYLLTIRFWHYGEPLINKDLAEIIRTAKEYKIFTVLSSNCSLLAPEVGKKLIESRLDYLLVSINAATEETYKIFTQTEYFNAVIDNLRHFVSLKKEMGSHLPFINLQFIVMRDNFKEAKEMKRIFEYVGANKLSFKCPGFKRRELGLSNAQYQLRGLDTTFFCSLPYEELVICANGDVTPCALDIRNSFVMGNIFKDDFRMIWNGEKYRDFRKTVNHDINSINICVDCCKKNNPDFFLKI